MAKKKKQITPVPSWFRYAFWVIPIIALLVYIPSFNADFTLDDVLIVEDNTFIRSSDKLDDIWTSHYWAGKMDASDKGLYRPLTLTTYAFQYFIHGDNPVPYHVLNILLHALTCFILMKFAKLLFKDYLLMILSGLWFAIHPVHVEAVSGIVGRAEILSALFILTAGICYHYYRLNGQIKWLAGLVLSAVAAITSKEHGFMLPFILLLQEAFYSLESKNYKWSSARKWIAIGSVIVFAGILWIIRGSITGPTMPHEQWRAVDTSDRMATSVRTSFEYAALHIFPWKLNADYWTDTVPIAGWGDPEVLISLLLMIALLAVAFWQRHTTKAFSWGILFFLLTLAPVSNFFFAAGFLKAERILYIPSIGLIIGLSALFVRLYQDRRGRIPAIMMVTVFSLFFCARTWLRAGDWKSNFTLAEATLKTSPQSPRFNNMMGLELRALKRNEEALMFFEKAVQSNPNHVPALVNLGTEYKNFNRLDEAAITLEKALATDPSILATYVNLMSIYRSMEKYDQNVIIADKAVSRFPNSAAVLWNAANAYHLKNDMVKANQLRTKAIELDPSMGK